VIRGRRQALRLGEDGLTVVEILLAVAIIGVALGGLGIVVPVSSYAVQDGNQLSTATFLANERLEQVMVSAFQDVLKKSVEHKVNLRIAAFMVAIERVVRVIELRGVYA